MLVNYEAFTFTQYFNTCLCVIQSYLKLVMTAQAI